MPFVPFVGLNHHRSTTIFACAVVSHETTESFKWLLCTLLVAMYQKEPKSVITDGDHAMRRAIQQVLPNSIHRLCTWHVERNMTHFIHHCMIPDFRELIYKATTPSQFVRRWKDFVEAHKIGEGKKSYKWLSRMYKIRKLWAASYVKNKYFLGAQSNQRSESLNSQLHTHLNRKMTLAYMEEHFFRCVKRIRRNEYELDCVASQSLPVLITEHKPLEMDAAKCFTPANFQLVQKEIERSSNYEIVEILENENCIKYIVSAREYTSVRFVECDDEETLANIKCNCLKFEREGIPCCHVMLVLIKHDALIPRSCVLTRWTQNAKSSILSDEKKNESSQQERFAELVNLSKPVF
ncbi:protein FAR1-RELATED SEQUENCE 5 [Triticum aestivum]|uniref:protein FAR1-RELATED SEQUENCE 5 n=1 Tax=Triticum aestivum TaxID=4565 RepID=UPI001D00F4A9|nr:protein FAR1-RELATED SEQUENCE 5-like [Triticum aestivum]